jgi:hypothetical protein
MLAFSNSDIIRFWELAKDSHPLDRALLAIAIASDNNDYDSLAKLNIGQRDILLFNLYQSTFGTTLNGITNCPECNTELQFEMHTTDILKHSYSDIDNGQFTLQLSSEKELTLRLPNSYDLAQAINNPAANPVHLIIDACVADPNPQITEDDVQEISDAIEQRDPYVNITLDFSCSTCGFHWQSILDILEFLWSEVVVTAKQLLNEVHLIASHYGWSEQEILALRTTRRKHYIDLIQTR